MPLLANYQSTPFNPFHLVFTIIPALKLLDAILLFKLGLLALFTYLLARELGLSSLSATASALTICFCGYVSKYVNHINLNTELWVPAGIFIVERMLKNRATLPRFCALSLVSALALIGGNPEAAFYFLVFTILYSIIRGGRQALKPTLAIILALGFGFALGSVQLFSFIDYLSFAWHFHDTRIHTLDALPLRWFFSLFFPWMFGPLRAGSHASRLLGYIGAIPLLLALMSIFRTRRMPRSWIFFWICALLFLGLVYRLPPFSSLNYLPILNQVRSAKYGYFEACFCLAMLAGLGLENFLQARISSRQFGIALALVSMIMLLSLALARAFHPPSFTPRIISLTWLIPVSILWFAGLAGLAGIFFRQRKFAGALLVLLNLGNLLYYATGLKPISEIIPEICRYKNPVPPPILTPIMQDKSWNRFLGTDGVFMDNFNIFFGLNDLRAFEALFPKGYVQAIAQIDGFKMEDAIAEHISQGWQFYVKENGLSHPLLNRLGVKYLISDHELQSGRRELLARTRDHWLYLNKDAWPRVWAIDGSGRKDFQKASIIRHDPDRVLLQVSDEASQVVLADQYAPGWRAFSLPAGKELKIDKEDLLFRKVLITGRDRLINFFYQPRGFELGLFSSLSSLFWLLLLTAVPRLRRFQNRGP